MLIVTSGKVVHNLRGMDWKLTDDGYDWTQRFDEDAKTRMLADPTDFATLGFHREFRRAVPTPDHFIRPCTWPGLAGAADTRDVQVLRRGLRLRVTIHDGVHPRPHLPEHSQRAWSPRSRPSTCLPTDPSSEQLAY